jgi:iron transport multicopper oxidase
MQQIAVDKKPMIQENRDTPTTVFSFAGQSTDNRGIAKTLFSSCAGFHNSLVSHEKIVLGLGFPSILEYLTGDDDGSPSWPIVEQLSLVSFEIAMAEIWKSWGISLSMVIGHGLGEYSALCVAGALSVADAIYVVGKRAKLMQTRCSTNTHAMLTTPLSLKSAQEHCTSFASCEISCINGPNSTVISGSQEDLRELQSRLDLQGIKAKALVASYAFHSAQMDRILFPLREIIQSVSFSVPTVPILSSLLGTVIEAGNVIEPDYLLRHVRRPVNFLGAVQSREYDQSTTWLECGPEPGCQSMIKTLTNTAQTNLMPGLKKGLDCWKSLCENLATFYLKGQEIRWSAFYKDSDPNLRLLDLPPYAFDTQNFYINLKEADIQDTPTRKRKRTQKPLSTCVQFVEEENIDPRGDATIRFVSDPQQEQLLAAIEGHCVQGHSLCPSSVYVDMAVTSARHLYCRRNNVGAGSAIEVTDIEIFRPLVVLSAGPDMQVSVQPRMSLGYGTVHVSIGSQQTNETLVHHSTCKVQFRDNEAWKDEWARYADMITARMNQLVSMERKQEICRIPGKILYQMYASIVDYNEKYRSISDIYIDCDHKEACGTIHLPVALEYGKFTCCPYSVDGIIHFAGFLLNNGIGRVKDTAYISTGLESIRILQDRLTAKSYQIYSRMKESKEKSYWVGDVYLLDGEEIVATCFGLKFQQMKLSLLNHLLGGSKVGLGTNNEI